MPLARSLIAILAVIWAAACNSGQDRCDGNVVVRCTADEWFGTNCSSEDCGDSFCVEAEVGVYFNVLCAPEREPRAECLLVEAPDVNGNFYSTCGGSEKLRCSAGYLIETFDCGGPDLCHVAVSPRGDRNVHCILSATQDPRCLPIPEQDYFNGIMPVCDGTLALGCFDGFLAKMEDCAATGGTCQDGQCKPST